VRQVSVRPERGAGEARAETKDVDSQSEPDGSAASFVSARASRELRSGRTVICGGGECRVPGDEAIADTGRERAGAAHPVRSGLVPLLVGFALGAIGGAMLASALRRERRGA
jgi:hypothetical protein